LSLIETQKLAENLKVEWHNFIRDYTDSRWPGTKSFLIKKQNGTCFFLKTANDKKQRLCHIHSCKPICCQEWKSGFEHAECRQGLFEIWGLTVDSSNQICGPLEKILEFESYVKELSSEIKAES
jgi:hypothetical protein